MRAGPVRILLVEDNPGDVRLTREAFKDAKVQLELSVVSDGVEAMDFLRRRGKYAESLRPDLILLDLNLPRMDGRAVLDELKGDPALKSVPVIILSTSSLPEDIEHSYEHNANCYVSKPVLLEGFLDVVRGVDEFWLTSLAGLRGGRG
jgi:two-component system, chemotaxis family, response regulator Rcp1